MLHMCKPSPNIGRTICHEYYFLLTQHFLITQADIQAFSITCFHSLSAVPCFSHLPLSSRGSDSQGFVESCYLEIVCSCSCSHLQLGSRGREKQFHAWATVNPSLSVPLLDALKSQTPLLPHSPTARPRSHQPLLLCDQGVAEHRPGREMRMRFTCSLTIPSSLMSLTSVPWHLQFPAVQ